MHPRSLLLPLLVAGLTLGLTGWLWHHEGQIQAQALQRQFDAGVRQAASLLERAGDRASTLDDPRQALAQVDAADDPVALVVTDFNMPEMSGLELARALRRLCPDLPVIVTSGYVAEDLPVQARAAGVAHVLQKEYTAEQLVPLVHRILAGS